MLSPELSNDELLLIRHAPAETEGRLAGRRDVGLEPVPPQVVSILQSVFEGVDLALWDLLGKYVEQPLYRLLGGKYRDAMPTYSGLGGRTIEELQANARAALDR